MEEVDVTSFLWLRQTPGAAFEHENDSVCSQRASLFVVHEHSPRFLFVFFFFAGLENNHFIYCPSCRARSDKVVGAFTSLDLMLFWAG